MHANGNGKAEERGWYFPPRLVRLYTQRTINSSEFTLLGLITSLSHHEKGCFASNTWLAQWWGKTPNHVSASIRKFRSLGLIKMRLVAGNKREIQVTFNCEEPSRKTVTSPTKNHDQRQDKSLPPHSHTSDEDKIDRNRDAMHPVGSVIFSNGKVTDPPSRLVQMFVELSVTQRWHVGKRGSTRTGWTKHTIQRWEKSCRDLIDQLGGEWRQVRRVLKWYIAHFEDDYVPRCETMKSFCERFSRLERVIRRANKGEDPVEDEYCPTIEVTEV